MTLHHDVKMSGVQNKPALRSLQNAICESVVAVSAAEKLTIAVAPIADRDISFFVALCDAYTLPVSNPKETDE